MKIIKYEFTKKNNYNIYLDNGEVITLKESVITENELLLKKEINEELYNKLIIDNRIYELYEVAIKYINVRLRSIKEIKDYLLKKEKDTNIVNIVCNRLIKNGYLDDEIFTGAYIKDKLNFTTMGDYKLKKELERLGVESNIIEEHLSNIDNNLLEERIKKIIDKDIRNNKKYSGINLKNKIYNHLLSQGYSSSIVINIINTYDFQYIFLFISKNINGDKMKKIILVFTFLLLLVGCSLSNSPTSKVEDLLTKYQTLDKDITENINDVVSKETLTEDQVERYKSLIEKQYRNLTYEVKDERYDGNNATITVEIEVLDYKKAINEVSASYLQRDDYTVEEYNDTKLAALEQVKEKVLYTIDFDVNKDTNGNWRLANLNNETIKKILGMY